VLCCLLLLLLLLLLLHYQKTLRRHVPACLAGSAQRCPRTPETHALSPSSLPLLPAPPSCAYVFRTRLVELMKLHMRCRCSVRRLLGRGTNGSNGLGGVAATVPAMVYASLTQELNVPLLHTRWLNSNFSSPIFCCIARVHLASQSAGHRDSSE